MSHKHLPGCPRQPLLYSRMALAVLQTCGGIRIHVSRGLYDYATAAGGHSQGGVTCQGYHKRDIEIIPQI